MDLDPTIRPPFEHLSCILGRPVNVEHRLAFSLLPLWYDVDTPDSLSLLRSMVLARRIEHRDRLLHTERVLDTLNNPKRNG